MSNQSNKNQASKFKQKNPKQQLESMIRYREFSKQQNRELPESMSSPEDHFLETVIDNDLVEPYVKDPRFDIPIHSENACRGIL